MGFINNFILEKGERALFSYSLETVKSLYQNDKYYANKYKELGIERLSKDLMDLYVFKYLYIKSLNDTNKLFNLFQDLFLFVNKEFAFEWENNLKWNREGIGSLKKSIYSDLFSKNTPSILYLFDGEEGVWENWYSNNPDEVLEVVDFSIKKVESLFNDCLVTNKSSLYENIDTLSEFLDFTEETKKIWFFINLLRYESKVNNAVLSEFAEGLKIILDIASNIFSIDNLFEFVSDKENILFRNKLLSLKKDIKLWSDAFEDISNIDKSLNKKYITNDGIVDYFVKKISLPLPEKLSFNYIQEYALLDSLFSNVENQISLVIEGSAGVGKKTLVGYFCKKKNIDIFVGQGENKKIIESIVKKKNGVLLVEQKSLVELNEALCSKIFCVKENSLYDKHTDLIVKVVEPNLEQRINLAKNYFEDENIAIKVSQRVKTVAEIYQIYKFCKKINNFSWSYVQLLINNISNVKSKSVLNLDKWENSSDVVPFFGSTYLKKELSGLIHYFNEPSKYFNIGVKAKKGVLLVGPPGTGKTHFVRNLAKEISVPVYSIESSLLAKDISLISRVFDFLRTVSPCVLFIDEVDVLMSSENNRKSLQEKAVINSFLINMDGLENNDGILVIGATHREENLEMAALRSGRFDTILNFHYPNPEDRKDVWKIYLETVKYASDVNVEELTLLSDSFSCADIAEAVNKASVIAVSRNKDKVDLEDFKSACEIVYWGSDVFMPMKEETLLSTCYHEAGHAIAIFHSQKYISDRVMVKPKKSSLGLTSVRLECGDYNLRLTDLYKRIQIDFGGLVAEEIVYGESTTGVSADMFNANKTASSIIEKYSMHPNFLGSCDKKYASENNKVLIENEIQKILTNEYHNTHKILLANRDLLEEIAHKLFKQHEISGTEMIELSKKIKLVELEYLFKKESIVVNVPSLNKDSIYHTSTSITVHKD